MPRSRRCRFRARGFQAIGWSLVFFVAANFAWLGVTEFVYPAFWDLIYAAKFDALRARIDRAPNRPLWLMLGTSKLQQGFRPLMLDPKLTAPDAPLIFNFGLPGADALREWICLRRLHAAGIYPKAIGIEVHGPLLNRKESSIVRETDQIIWARRDELDLLSQYSTAPAWMKRTWWQSRLVSISGSRLVVLRNSAGARGLLFHGVNPESRRHDAAGWYRQTQSFDWPRQYPGRLAGVLNDYREIWRDFRITPDADQLLRQLITTCRAQGARVFLFRMPESSGFRAAYPPGALEASDAYISGLAGEFGLPFIDALTWLDDRAFADGVHLLGSGAAAFTEKFEDALQPLLQNPPEPQPPVRSPAEN